MIIIKIGIMGGTFNPIHYGHLIMAESARVFLNLDKVIFIPSGNPWHKDNSQVISGEERIYMTKLAIETNAYFQVSSMEIERKGITYTIDTIRELRDIYPEDELYFIIGSDSLFQLHKWKDYKDLIQLCKFIVADRPGSDNDKVLDKIKEYNEKLNGQVIKVDIPLIDISSTEIRNRIKKDISIKYLIPESVEKYIQENGIFK